MALIPLQAIPNQALSVRLNGVFFNLVIKEANGIMAVDISRNNVVVETGIRIVAGTSMIPFRHLEDNSGNFVILTQNGDYPYYTEFGITQFLVYTGNDVLEQIRAGT